MNCWHFTWSTVGRQPLAPTEAGRRQLVRTLARVAGGTAALFNVVDDHVHLVLLCDDGRRGIVSSALTRALRSAAAAELDPPHIRAVADRGHMDWLADAYILRQSLKHGVGGHPALWSGSCFADLAGARVLPGEPLCIAQALPRWRVQRAYAAVGLPPILLNPADDVRLRAVGAHRLTAASAAALAADPALAGIGALEVLGRRATARLAAAAGVPNSEVADALRVHPVAAARLRERPVEPAVLRAIRARVALEDAAASAIGRPLVQPPAATDPRGALHG